MPKPLVYLPDANILIALTNVDHASHAKATGWFTGHCKAFATCPITQGALLRFLMRTKPAMSLADATIFLEQVCAVPGHRFWPDSARYSDVPERGVTGYRQLTDAYLVALAAQAGGVVATLDQALAALHPQHSVLVS